VNDLRRAVAALAAARQTTERRMMALVGNMVLSQMLPDSAIKGGTGTNQTRLAPPDRDERGGTDGDKDNCADWSQ
jgi:hypothetical protein